jgi:7-keto-8-aminopelargonate synthetase-like enzyme
VAGTEGGQLRRQLWQNLELMAGRRPESAILPWIIGDEAAAVERSRALAEAGFLVPAIRYPTVARGAARLRITCTAAHQEAQVRSLRQALM